MLQLFDVGMKAALRKHPAFDDENFSDFDADVLREGELLRTKRITKEMSNISHASREDVAEDTDFGDVPPGQTENTVNLEDNTNAAHSASEPEEDVAISEEGEIRDSSVEPINEDTGPGQAYDDSISDRQQASKLKNTIYLIPIGNVPETKIRSKFSMYGEIAKIKQPPGVTYGFIKFKRHSPLKNAVKGANKKKVMRSPNYTGNSAKMYVAMMKKRDKIIASHADLKPIEQARVVIKEQWQRLGSQLERAHTSRAKFEQLSLNPPTDDDDLIPTTRDKFILAFCRSWEILTQWKHLHKEFVIFPRLSDDLQAMHARYSDMRHKLVYDVGDLVDWEDFWEFLHSGIDIITKEVEIMKKDWEEVNGSIA
ncbi:hypothetical protein G7Y89_g710 [Cudoniella acicularis]|uniref:RRM domain-containing protein n=1 Tax=Cudoniella acicularis TaxID=354080 RepID=A0A8H4W7N7_9HELO|nr:hypothetical protein G7Y89_g710 [Cudoniella acicularis]